MARANKKRKRILYLFIGAILLISIILNTFLLLKYKVLPAKYFKIYTIIVIIIPLIMILYTVFRKRRAKIKGIMSVIEIIYIFVLFIVFFYLNNTFNFLERFTSQFEYETKQYSVLVLDDSNYKEIRDLKGKKVGYTSGLDTSIDLALKDFNKKVKVNFNKYDGYGELFTNLDNKNVDAIIIASPYYDTLIENDENYSYSKYRLLTTLFVKEKRENSTKSVNVTKEAFNIYLTGIDSYGDITEQTRSDVNIVISVNPRTNKIVLINIPRDYYVDIVGKDIKDKLTHAGIYGIETSVKTVEKLLDTDINYYVKVNYNAIIKLVDTLGGVDVESEYDFKSFEFRYPFKKGINHVDGKLALDFVRTRKAFIQGDRVRGENQQRMIQAIFKKASSPSILIKYDDILKSLDGNFITNLKTDDIMSLINMQLDKMPSWEFSTFSLNGGDDYVLTPSNQRMYVMVPKEETVNEGREIIKENLK